MTKAEATTLGDRYRLDVHRASLPFGDLWEADDTQGARVLVLLSPPQQSNPDEQAMAAVEASGAVSSPNAVGWTDGGSTEEDRFWLAAPLVGHTSFSEAVAEHDGVTTEEGARLVHQVARAVTAAEQASQHHHALCGDLIRLVERTDGEGTAVKVYGWGLEGLLPPYKPLRRHDPFLGVPDYMAPELCRGREGTESADVYALGTLLYEAVRGRPPFSARTASASASTTMKRQIYENPLALHVRYGDLSHIKSYESVTLRALSKQPSHRPNDAASLAQELEDFLTEAGDAPVPEDQVPTGESGRVRDRRTQVLSGLAGQARAVQKEVDAQGEATSPEDAAEATGGSGSSSSGGGDQPTTGGKRGSATKRRKRKRKYSGRVDHHADTMIFDAVPGGAEASSEAAGASSSETSGEEPVETATSDGGTPESASDSEATKGAGQAADDASAHETVVDSPTVSGAEEAGEARSEEAAEAGGEEAAEAGGEEAAEAEGEEAAEAAQAEAPAKPDEGGPEGASEDATVAELRETAAKEAEAPRDRREEQPTAVEFPGVDPDQDVDDQWFVDAAEDLSSHQAPEDTFDAEKGTAHSLRFWSIASIVTLVLIGAVYALVDAGGSGPSSEPTRAKLEAPGSRGARGGGAREGSSEGAAAAADRDEEESDERGIDDSVRNELRRQALLGEDDDEPGRTAGEEIGKLAARREGASGQQRGAPSDDDRAGAGGTAGASDDRDETGGGGGDSDGPSDGEDGAAAAAAGDGSGSREGAGSGASETTGGDGDDEETAGQPDRGDDAAGSSTGAEARRQKQAEADEKAQERKKAEDDKAEEPKKAEAEDDKAETEDDEAEEPKKAEAEDDEAEEPKKAEAEDDKADDEGGGSEEESTEDKSRRYIKLGIKAYKAGNYELASGYFEKAQKLDDGNRVAAKYLKMARSKMEDE